MSDGVRLFSRQRDNLGILLWTHSTDTAENPDDFMSLNYSDTKEDTADIIFSMVKRAEMKRTASAE